MEYMRRWNKDRLSTLEPEILQRNFIHMRFLDTFLVNKPEYTEEVRLTN